jgi:thymidylate synthase
MPTETNYKQRRKNMNVTVADLQYTRLLEEIVNQGTVIRSRNSIVHRKICPESFMFTSFPLITVRKTAMKMALREYEWFLSGDDKCPDELLPWWGNQLNPEGRYVNGYSTQLVGKGCNQIDTLLESLKSSPYSRRHLFSMWNTADMANITDANQNPRSPATCFPGWVTVLTPDGLKSLSELSIGETIWNGFKYVTVTNKWSKGVQDVYCAETRKGSLYATADHIVHNGTRKLPLNEAKRLQLLTGPVQPVTLDPVAILDGLCIADGVDDGSKVMLHIGEKDQDYFNSEISSLLGKSRTHDKTLHSCQNTLTRIGPTYNRKVPLKYLHGSFHSRCSFLRGLFSGNGCNSSHVTLTGTSKVLMDQVQLMLNSVGIRSSMQFRKGVITSFRNGDYQCKDSYNLTILKRDEDIFFKQIGFIQKYKQQKNKEIARYTNTALVKKFQLYSTEEVFDITVDSDDHMFWCNGFNVSNCHGTAVQVFVEPGVNGELDEMHMFAYQRSADVILGLPHNLVQYWSLLVFLTKQLNMKPAILHYQLGDAHIYDGGGKHLEAAKDIIHKMDYNFKPIEHLQLVFDGGSEYKASEFRVIGKVPEPICLIRPDLID